MKRRSARILAAALGIAVLLALLLAWALTPEPDPLSGRWITADPSSPYHRFSYKFHAGGTLTAKVDRSTSRGRWCLIPGPHTAGKGILDAPPSLVPAPDSATRLYWAYIERHNPADAEAFLILDGSRLFVYRFQTAAEFRRAPSWLQEAWASLQRRSPLKP